MDELLAGKYVLESLIGAGGMGLVYAATQPAMRRKVAIKILRDDLRRDPRSVRQFEREALACSRVTHPGLVAVHELAEADDGRLFLAMEYVPGRALGPVVRGKPVTPQRACDIARQIVDAIGEAHRAGIIHGDLKSDNVMIEADEQGRDRVKVVDFGLARVAARVGDRVDDPRFRDESVFDQDGERFVSGTPEYIAPEVIRGGPTTPASDLYAVGAILYELLTGATPFAGGSTIDVLMCHLNDPVVPPSVKCPDRGIPRALDDIVIRALAKTPAARYRDADALADALARALPATKRRRQVARGSHREEVDRDSRRRRRDRATVPASKLRALLRNAVEALRARARARVAR